MQKVFTSVKEHMNDNRTVVREHLRSNSGDGYIWFLFITVAFLLVFGALFTIMSTAVNMKTIRTDVDEVALDVFAEIREVSYDSLTDGATNFSDTNLSSTDIMRMMAKHLGATFDNTGLHPRIYKNDARGNLDYEITNLQFQYIDQTTSSLTAVKKGDIDRNGNVDDSDTGFVEAYLAGDEIPDSIDVMDMDLNGDKSIDRKDLLLLKGLVDYFKLHPEDSLESIDKRRSALLMITFEVKVPIDFGTVHLGTSVDEYFYHSLLSFKAA